MGDGTQSATLDHVILVNFPDTSIRVTAEALGDIQHDHLYLKLGLDSTIFGRWAAISPPNTSTGPRLEAKTRSKVRQRVDDSTAVFNRDVETKLHRDVIGVNEAVDQVFQNKLGTALAILTEERQRPPGNSEEGSEEQSLTRDRVRRKTQSWAVIRSLDMIVPEVINSAVSRLMWQDRLFKRS